MKTTFVENIQERTWVDSVFLVRDKIMAMAKNGKPYMTLKLIDRTGEVEGRIWDRVDEFSALFEKNDFLRVKGKASVYMGKMQLVIQDLTRLGEDQVSLADYLPVAPRPIEEMQADLHTMVQTLADPHLKQLLESFFADATFLRDFSRAPAAKSMHHVYIGGLLEHSLSVANLVDDVCRRYPELHRDLLMVGALLHDIGKVAELSFERSFDYTDEGKLLGHIVMGTEMVEEKVRSIEGFPRQLAMLVKHLLLSHHGQYEYGSPKRPKTMEAVVLNFLDDLDAKVNGVRSHIDRESRNGDGWTSYHRLYDRYFFCAQSGEDEPSAASDVPAPQERESAAPAAAAAPPPPEPRARQKEQREDRRGRGFGFSLGEQLKEKNLDLFSLDDEDKE